MTRVVAVAEIDPNERLPDMRPATIHASAVLLGARAVLIRGPAGAGKSRLALALLEAGRAGAASLTRLVGDDRVHVEARNGRLLVSPAPALAGLIEVRGLGIRTVAFEPVAVAGLVVDLAAGDAARLPAPSQIATIGGVPLPRLAVAPGWDARAIVLAYCGYSANAEPEQLMFSDMERKK